MTQKNTTPSKEVFTAKEKETLHGLAQKIANKHQCSSMYVRHIINGNRGTTSALAQAIIRDLEALLMLLHPKQR